MFYAASYQTGGSSGTVQGNTTVTDGNWHHVGIVQNGTAYTFYVDGAADGSITSGTPVTYDSGRGGAIGYDPLDVEYGSDPQYFYGSIDEVGVWNASLSASDFANLYNSGAGRQYPF